jgi:hypothetical protein
VHNCTGSRTGLCHTLDRSGKTRCESRMRTANLMRACSATSGVGRERCGVRGARPQNSGIDIDKGRC